MNPYKNKFEVSLRSVIENDGEILVCRNKKKGYYWKQVKSKGGGSNYYLSGERYMSTQAG